MAGHLLASARRLREWNWLRLGCQWVVFLVVVVLLAPLRPAGGPAANAGMFVPLLSTHRVADSAAFHRRASSWASDLAGESGFRVPDFGMEPGSVLESMAAPRVQELSQQLAAPRQSWVQLTRAVRTRIDAAHPENSRRPRNLVIHGSGMAGGDARKLQRFQLRVRQSADAGHHFIIGNGQGMADGRIEVTCAWDVVGAGSENVSICVMGDFQKTPPTRAQITALDELVDYLRLKLGIVPVLTHAGQAGRRVTCMGAAFPERPLLEHWNAGH